MGRPDTPTDRASVEALDIIKALQGARTIDGDTSSLSLNREVIFFAIKGFERLLSERDAAVKRADETRDELIIQSQRLRVTQKDLAALRSRLEAEPSEAEKAIEGITDDYMTSETHHPGYVLIPAAKFEQLRAVSIKAPARRDQAEPSDVFARLLVAAKLLYENSKGCAQNHYGNDLAEQGMPGWLSDTWRDIERADAALRAAQQARKS